MIKDREHKEISTRIREAARLVIERSAELKKSIEDFPGSVHTPGREADRVFCEMVRFELVLALAQL